MQKSQLNLWILCQGNMTKCKWARASGLDWKAMLRILEERSAWRTSRASLSVWSVVQIFRGRRWANMGWAQDLLKASAVSGSSVSLLGLAPTKWHVALIGCCCHVTHRVQYNYWEAIQSIFTLSITCHKVHLHGNWETRVPARNLQCHMFISVPANHELIPSTFGQTESGRQECRHVKMRKNARSLLMPKIEHLKCIHLCTYLYHITVYPIAFSVLNHRHI